MFFNVEKFKGSVGDSLQKHLRILTAIFWMQAVDIDFFLIAEFRNFLSHVQFFLKLLRATASVSAKWYLLR